MAQIIATEGRSLDRHTSVIVISPSDDVTWVDRLREACREVWSATEISVPADPVQPRFGGPGVYAVNTTTASRPVRTPSAR